MEIQIRKFYDFYVGFSSSELPNKKPLSDDFFYDNDFIPAGFDLFKNESTGKVIRKHTTKTGKFYYKDALTGKVLFFEEDVDLDANTPPQ